MADYFYDLVDPVELTGAVRAAIEDDADALPFRDVLPLTPTPDIEYSLSQLETRGGTVARYRAWDTPPKLGRRPGVTVIEGEIPPLSVSFILKEKEINQTANVIRALTAGQSIDPAFVQMIFDDAVNGARGIMWRLSWAMGELFTSGKVRLVDLDPRVPDPNAVSATFNVPAGHLGVAPLGAAWTNTTTSVPLTDLKTWEIEFRSNNSGRSPEVWFVSSTTEALLAQNTQVRAQLLGAPSGYVPTGNDVRTAARQFGVRGELITSDVEIPLLDDDEATGRVIPEEYVIGMRGSVLGSTLIAPSSNAAMIAAGAPARTVIADQPGVIAFQTFDVNPALLTTTADAVALPILRDPNALFVATAWTP